MVEFDDCKDADDIGVIDLCKGSPNLKKLSLRYRCENLSLRGRVGFTDAVVLAVTTYCPDIEVLSLNGWSLVTDAAMSYLGNLSSLKEVCLCLCPNLTSTGVQNLIKANNNNLEVLILSEIVDQYLCPAEPFIDAALLTCIGNHCPRLIKLHVTIPEEGSDVTDESLTAMLAGCPLLEELTLGEFNKPNNTMHALAAHCNHLKRLMLVTVELTAAGVALVCEHCPELQSLKLMQCTRLIDGDNAVFAIAAHCPKLQEFALTCSTVHDESLCALFKACADLRAVRLELNIWVTGQSTATLLEYCPKLQYLRFEVFECTDINSLGIATYGKALEHLEVIGELQATDDPVGLISKGCPRLKTFILHSYYDVTERTVRAVLVNCPHLVELRVRARSKLSDEFEALCDGIGKRYRAPRLLWK